MRGRRRRPGVRELFKSLADLRVFLTKFRTLTLFQVILICVTLLLSLLLPQCRQRHAVLLPLGLISRINLWRIGLRAVNLQ